MYFACRVSSGGEMELLERTEEGQICHYNTLAVTGAALHFTNDKGFNSQFFSY